MIQILNNIISCKIHGNKKLHKQLTIKYLHLKMGKGKFLMLKMR